MSTLYDITIVSIESREKKVSPIPDFSKKNGFARQRIITTIIQGRGAVVTTGRIDGSENRNNNSYYNRSDE